MKSAQLWSALLLNSLPLLLLFLLPFNIPLSVFAAKYAKYGSLNPYLIAVAFGFSAYLWIDWWIRFQHFFSKDAHLKIWMIFALLISFLIRIVFFPFESDDYCNALSMWFDFIQKNGGFQALSKGNFSDYNVLYLYIIALLTYLPFRDLYAIKLVSVLFDYASAYVVYKIVRLFFQNSSLRPVIAGIAILFCPTVLLNGALWAQCDMMYVFFLLWATYFFIKQPSSGSQIVFFFTWAFLFKLQAVFFALPLLYGYCLGFIRKRHLSIFAGLWFLTCLPAWLLGRSWIDMALIYIRQIGRSHPLSLNAPSIYQIVSHAPTTMFKYAGILLVIFIILSMILYFLAYRPRLTPQERFVLVMLSLGWIPYLLPQMHERYFFGVDVLSVIYIFLFPTYWYRGTLLIFCSFMSYQPYLFQTTPVPLLVLSLLYGYTLITISIQWFQSIHFKGVESQS
ncbi:MAG: glycosyltransferase family 39 protein [Cytophagales bacterium]|nr:glycosyltransferase family 39 protein [Cytophagales bacterium]MDW8384906.1 glycosyltransferase family 39 protein [Flammeovirgaceae bacterium]